MGRVKNIFIKPAHGEPMTGVAAALAVSGKGLEGDVSFGRRDRQVLLIDIETLHEFGVEPGAVRENLTLEGFDLSEISSKDYLEIGETLLAVTGPCEPCSKLDALGPNLSSEFRGRRGVLARVVRGGELRINDRVILAGNENLTPTTLS